MLNEQELKYLSSSTSKAELKKRTETVRASILRTLSEKNSHRPQLLRDLDDLTAQISARLPDISSRALKRIEDDIAASTNPADLEKKLIEYDEQASELDEVRRALERGRDRWREKEAFASAEEQRRAEAAYRSEMEDLEFARLVEEVKALRFTESRQVSQYIIKNKLGSKYKHISGVLEMERGPDSWKYCGGFPPHIYARLCEALELGTKDSGARVKSFKSYKEIGNGLQAKPLLSSDLSLDLHANWKPKRLEE